MGMAEGVGAGRAVCGINVTPLIDVLLVLLILFMVIVPATPKGLNAVLPRPATGQSSPEAPIVVSVQAGPQGETVYRINQDSLPQAQVEARLAAIFAARQQRTMFVQADRAVAFDRVAAVVNLGRQAGAENIGLLTATLADAR